ncbi:MAG TPA: hypothetical protein VF323_04830, partial [Candidatus Limnocylindrales bacterium]
DRILALAGTTTGTAASSGVVSNGASPFAAARAAGASGSEDEMSAAGAEARGMARPTGGLAGATSIELVGLLGGSLAVVVCLGFSAAQIAGGRRLRIGPKRPAGLARGARDGGEVAPK